MKKQYNVLLVTLLVAGMLYLPNEKTQGIEEPLAQVKSLYNQGQFVEAYQEAKKIAKEGERNPEAWFWLGLTAHKNNQHKEAFEAYQKAIKLKSDYAEAYKSLGDLYEGQGWWKDAIEHYQKALKIRSNLADAYVGLGEVYRKNGVWAKAVENYKKAVEFNPKDIRSQRFVETCSKALNEKKQSGYVSHETLRQIALVEFEIRRETSGAGAKSLDEPLDISRLPLHIEFSRNKFAFSDLSDNGREQLKQVAAALQSPEWHGKKIVIEGHTCACGSNQDNKKLGQKRAETVRDYLTSQGVVKVEDVSIFTYGESNPVGVSSQENLPPEQCEVDEAHSMNRRVVIRERRGEEFPQNPGFDDPPLGLLPQPKASAKVAFWYRQGSNGQFRRLTNGEVLRSGDEVKLFLLAYQSVYAYIFHHGSNGNWVCLFPNEKFCKEVPAKNPLEPERKYWLPRFGSGIPLDSVPGAEEIFVYLSSGADPEMETWVKEGISPSGRIEGGEVEEVVVKIQARGLGGLIAEDQQDIYLPANWYTQIKFQHEP